MIKASDHAYVLALLMTYTYWYAYHYFFAGKSVWHVSSPFPIPSAFRAHTQYTYQSPLQWRHDFSA